MITTRTSALPSPAVQLARTLASIDSALYGLDTAERGIARVWQDGDEDGALGDALASLLASREALLATRARAVA